MKDAANFEKLLAQYDYAFPESAVGLIPAEPRDSARLLAYSRGTGESAYATFRDLPGLLPPKSLLVMNETKVIPARIEAAKPTGGKVRVLYVRDESRGRFRALADRPLKAGDTLSVGRDGLVVEERDSKGYVFSVAKGRVAPLALFMKHGLTPIPPYLKRTPLGEKALRSRYQTVFAKAQGSVAAPTASLHFTKRLIAALKKAGHEIVFVTLHVNLGTFAPLTPEAIATGRLHEEQYEIRAAAVAAIARARKQGRPIIPVGTTALRALESAADARGQLMRLSGATRIFIRPGYRFRVADGLITNFHVPKSSLMMLVAAMVGRERLLALYADAIKRGFRLFSFGDGMLILPHVKRKIAVKKR